MGEKRSPGVWRGRTPNKASRSEPRGDAKVLTAAARLRESRLRGIGIYRGLD
jgi:hypothetical protein